MKTGLSTWAYFWQLSEKAPKPLSLFDAIDDSQRLGATVFQICDYPQIAQWSSGERTRLAEHAARAGITLNWVLKALSQTICNVIWRLPLNWSARYCAP